MLVANPEKAADYRFTPALVVAAFVAVAVYVVAFVAVAVYVAAFVAERTLELVRSRVFHFRGKAPPSWRPLGVVGPGIVSAADARHRSLRDHGALGSRVLTRPADRPLAPVPTR